jgi:hypothetical protein
MPPPCRTSGIIIIWDGRSAPSSTTRRVKKELSVLEEDERSWWVKEHNLQNAACHPNDPEAGLPRTACEVLRQGPADGRC